MPDPRKAIRAAPFTLLLAALAWPVAAPAQEDGPEPAPDLRVASIFQHQRPQQAHPWRAAAEIGAGLAFQMTVYVKNPSSTAMSGEATVHSPIDKLFHGAWSFDGNEERTNYGAHPLGGALFYLVARGNRLGTLESSLAAVAGSTIWELGEVRENASINDAVLTPLAGIAIGEPLAQLSAFFEQRDAGGGDRALAWLFQPFKKGHDLLDGARVARRPEALARGELRLGLEAGSALRGGAWRPEAGVRLSAMLVRDRDYGSAGRDVRTLRDGNWVRLEAGVAGASDGLARTRFESDAMLLTLHARDLEGEDEPVGQDLLLGVGVGFEVETRRGGRGERTDFRSLVHAPGIAARWRLAGGALPLVVTGRTGFTFGGVRSLVLSGDPGAVPPEDLPLVGRAYGYYHAWGGMLEGEVEARPGPLRLGGGVRLDALRGITGKDPEPLPGGTAPALRDRRGEARGWAQWVFGGWAAGAEVVRAWGTGEIGEARRAAAATEVRATFELRR